MAQLGEQPRFSLQRGRERRGGQDARTERLDERRSPERLLDHVVQIRDRARAQLFYDFAAVEAFHCRHFARTLTSPIGLVSSQELARGPESLAANLPVPDPVELERLGPWSGGRSPSSRGSSTLRHRCGWGGSNCWFGASSLRVRGLGTTTRGRSL